MSLTLAAKFRFCHKCSSLFREVSGPGNQGRCPASGSHEAQGYTFEIDAKEKETPTTQVQWESCRWCMAMYYNGFQDRGKCPGHDNGHIPEHHFNVSFGLLHDVPVSPKLQTAWRFCPKCFTLFFDGYPDKGRCSAGGGHVAQGWDFALLHLN